MGESLDGVFRDILAMASAFSVGTAVFAAALALRMVKANARRYLSFAAAMVGYATVTGVVLLRIILPLHELPVDGWGAFYTAGLVIGGIGFTGVGRVIRREFVDWETKQEETP
jgi:hypothetical protein